MKKSLLLVLLLSNFFGHAQYTLIPDVNFEQALISLGIDSGAVDGKVLTANVVGVGSLNLSLYYGISDLTGIQDFLALDNLDCSFNQITNLDVSKNINLIYLRCGKNLLTSLDVTKNTALIYLDCSQNQITSLDVTKNKALTTLYCGVNQITNLDVTKNTNLIDFHIYNNHLTSLDVTKNTALSSLICSINQITNLDVTKNTLLRYLDCSQNQITNLDVTENIILNILYCDDNQLTSLDVTKNTALTNLYCDQNKLTSLDVTKNTALTILDCNHNQITNLDVTKNTKIITLDCGQNQLTTLNLKNGNNSIISSFNSISNPNLTCIQVDNKAYSDAHWSAGKDATASYSENCSNIVSNTAPTITATGNQLYCPLTNMKIVTGVTITDPDDTGTDAIYIQIASGYVNGQDLLTLTGVHPTIISSWDASAGKLKLSSPTGLQVTYTDFMAAIQNVVFSNSSATPTGIRNFSINIGQANYLPSSGHYYQYISNVGITWSDAKTAAATSTYYGLQGYLATITALDEALLVGKQSSGAGWIGGSDATTEGVWQWVTGPEAGTTMAFTYWNNGEPNNQGDEDYAHITAPGVGVIGAWNDLSNTGDPSGNYQPKGYVVEYGGMPGDPVLTISTSTTMTMLNIMSTTPASRCGTGVVTLQATPSSGTIDWFSDATGGVSLGTGNSFITPSLTTTTPFYAEISGCTSPRTPVIATVYDIPIITSTNTPIAKCGAGATTLQATTSVGSVNWYASPTTTTVEATGTTAIIPNITASTTYYAEAVNNGCSNGIRVPVNITVYIPPVVTNEDVVLCKSQNVMLDAGLAGMSYLWSTGETTQQITVTTAGNYTVNVTSPAPENCTSTKTITVIEHSSPEIKNIDINETTITINLVAQENYFEFSIDGINFQDSNVFTNVASGLQMAYVREKNNCGEDNQPFVVIVIPKFFTPNGDGTNDIWAVQGLVNYSNAKLTIFDRYGKLLKQLNAGNTGWNGTFNGADLPATDYWYVLKLDETSPEVKGHFSLKR